MTGENSNAETTAVGIQDTEGHNLYGTLLATRCANPKCLKATVHLVIRSGERDVHTHRIKYMGEPLFAEQILPRGASKPQPTFIPAPLREDYEEACAIRQSSPKASATLARRCLQGMIRDFAGISKGRLIDEIDELRRLVDEGHAPKGVTAESVEAIDHVRGVGNVGAHMEKDINVIVPVDENEAQLLIELVEMLFAEWYVERDKRQQRLDRIAALAAEKKEMRKGPRNQPPVSDSDELDGGAP